ncbi:GlxA family transcriptional regulator [Vibrio sp. 10N]|uniref:GlxA family transcriptional regulator n=1 Tax=Vibrio sp. 10N TaxID=3058938 RepID=UPI002813747D|nr:GlxA family transcriptional regulator [Vibrio sp. 10N]
MIKVSILHYEDAMRSAIYGIMDLFTIANRLSQSDKFEVQHELDFDDTVINKLPDIVIVPPSGAHPLPDFKCLNMTSYLTYLANHNVDIAASCAGVFWLAEAGLLNGKNVTTHWNLCERLNREYPQINHVEKRDILVVDRGITTAAGLFAYQDLVLHLIAQYEGFELAKRVADFALLDINGRLQAYYERFVPDTSHGDAMVLKAQRYCTENPKSSVKDIAEHCKISERSLHRKFVSVLEISPREYIVQAKIEHARTLLCSSEMTVEKVAYELGYQDVSNFGRTFKKVTQLSPAAFRRRQINHQDTLHSSIK